MTGRRRRLLPVLIWLIIIIGLRPLPVAGHETLIASRPAAGEVLAEPPAEIRLTFSGPAAAGSQLIIYDDQFRPVPLVVDLDPERPADLVARDLEFPGPGRYTVQWEIAAEDGHPLAGSYQFTIGEPNMMELITAAESEAVNLPGWFAWLMVVLATISAYLVYRMSLRGR